MFKLYPQICKRLQAGELFPSQNHCSEICDEYYVVGEHIIRNSMCKESYNIPVKNIFVLLQTNKIKVYSLP